MEYNYYYPPYIITNLVAIIILIMATTRPNIARIMLGIVFIGAFTVNLITAIFNPSTYLEFGEMTSSELYREIILGPFSQNTRLYIILIALCQLFIGLFTTYEGKSMRIAMIGGMIFLFAISPLGFGSAFPATLIMGIAYVILLFTKIDRNVYDSIQRKMTKKTPSTTG